MLSRTKKCPDCGIQITDRQFKSIGVCDACFDKGVKQGFFDGINNKETSLHEAELLQRVETLTKENERLKEANLIAVGWAQDKIDTLKAENAALKEEIETLSKFDER